MGVDRQYLSRCPQPWASCPEWTHKLWLQRDGEATTYMGSDQMPQATGARQGSGAWKWYAWHRVFSQAAQSSPASLSLHLTGSRPTSGRPDPSLRLSFPSHTLTSLNISLLPAAETSPQRLGRAEGRRGGRGPAAVLTPPMAHRVLTEETWCIQIIKRKNWSD